MVEYSCKWVYLDTAVISFPKNEKSYLNAGSSERGSWSESTYRLEYSDSETSFYNAESILGK